MDGRREGGGKRFIHRSHDVVGDENRRGASAGPDPSLERQKIGGEKALQAPLIHGDARVGVHIISIAREVLEDAAHAAGLPHSGNHAGDIIRGGLGVLSQGPVIDKILWFGGDVCHRREIHVDA